VRSVPGSVLDVRSRTVLTSIHTPLMGDAK